MSSPAQVWDTALLGQAITSNPTIFTIPITGGQGSLRRLSVQQVGGTTPLTINVYNSINGPTATDPTPYQVIPPTTGSPAQLFGDYSFANVDSNPTNSQGFLYLSVGGLASGHVNIGLSIEPSAPRS